MQAARVGVEVPRPVVPRARQRTQVEVEVGVVLPVAVAAAQVPVVVMRVMTQVRVRGRVVARVRELARWHHCRWALSALAVAAWHVRCCFVHLRPGPQARHWQPVQRGRGPGASALRQQLPVALAQVPLAHPRGCTMMHQQRWQLQIPQQKSRELCTTAGHDSLHVKKV